MYSIGILRAASLHGFSIKMYRSCLNKVRGSFLNRICGRKLSSAVIQRLSTVHDIGLSWCWCGGGRKLSSAVIWPETVKCTGSQIMSPADPLFSRTESTPLSRISLRTIHVVPHVLSTFTIISRTFHN